MRKLRLGQLKEYHSARTMNIDLGRRDMNVVRDTLSKGSACVCEVSNEECKARTWNLDVYIRMAQ